MTQAVGELACVLEEDGRVLYLLDKKRRYS